MYRFLVATILFPLSMLGCDADPFPQNSGLDDGINGDTDAPQSMCNDYPAVDGNFNIGSVISNYKFFDQEDDEIQLCELVKPSSKLLFLAITAES